MRLPKWVVKWIKDDFDYGKLELKCLQQEAELKRLRRKLLLYKFEALPEDEKQWVFNTYLMLWGRLFGSEWDLFREKYILHQEEEEAYRGSTDRLEKFFYLYMKLV